LTYELTAVLENLKITAMSQVTHNPLASASIIKRLLAMFYDSFLLVAVLFLAMALMLLVTGGYQFQAGNPWITIYLLVVSYVFFGWFWTHGGQTLGMRAWKIRLQQHTGDPVNWRHATVRYVTALPAWILLFIGIALVAGIPLHSHSWLDQLSGPMAWLILLVGIVWLVVDQWPDGWRDKLSGTRVIKLSV